MRINLLFAAAVLTLAIAGAASAQVNVAGPVVDVVDGRTVVIAGPTGKIKAQLQYVDVPAAGQPLSDVVREHLRQLLIGKTVQFRVKAIVGDRTTGPMTLNGADVALQLLRDGAAWHIPVAISGQEKESQATYASTEAAAKSEKRGIWGVPGLKPSWEYLAANAVVAPPPVQIAAATPKAVVRPKSTGYWSDINPRLGSVGAFQNGYNAASKRGYIGTPALGISEIDKALETERRTAIEIAYNYTEDDKKGRTGYYVVNIYSSAVKWRFLEKNDLTVLADGVKTVIGKPKRTADSTAGLFNEKLTYQIDRKVIDRLANSGDVAIIVGGEMYIPTPGLQLLLYNMLDVSR